MSSKSIFDRYFKYIGNTETPIVYNRWTLISIVAALLGRRVWTQFGHMKVLPMQYIMFIDTPASRKSTAIETYGGEILDGVGFKKLAADRTSKEQLWEDLQAGKYAEYDMEIDVDDIVGEDIPREMYIFEDEIADFFGGGDTEGFCRNLAKLWTGKRGYFTVRNKNSKSVKIWQPTINILGGATPFGLTRMLGEHAIGTGFFSRVLYIKSPRHRDKVPPSKVTRKDPYEYAWLINHLGEVSCLTGELEIGKKEWKVIDEIYKRVPKIPDWRFDYYYSRRLDHFLKVLCSVTALKGDLKVDEEDIILSNTILHNAEAHFSMAIGEFGSARGADKTQILMDAINKLEEKMSQDDLFEKVGSHFDSPGEMSQSIFKLYKMKRIQMVKGKGKPMILPNVQTGNEWEEGYVDYSLLSDEENPNIGFMKYD